MGPVHRSLVLFAVAALAINACAPNSTTVATMRIQTQDLGADRYVISAPVHVPAGTVRVQFVNRGEIPHDAQLFRIDGNHSQAEVADTIRTDGAATPDWLHAEGGVGTLLGGQSATTTLKLTAGAYYICDTGVDEDNIAFAKAGAIRPLVVTGSSDGLPLAAATITAKEYAFDIRGLKAGTTSVRFENMGAQAHQFLTAPLLPNKSLQDVHASFDAPSQAQGSPVDLSKSITASRLDPGRSLVTTLHLAAGRYVFLCLLSDRQGGARHVALGMISEITVA